MSDPAVSDFTLSRDEFRNISRCLGDEEFRKLFIEYCNELQDPANKQQFEEELKVLEAERGYDVKFLKPQPGYVIKTIVDGRMKGFVNVCHSDAVGKPSSVNGTNEDGQKGLRWSIPYAQSHPRKDYDNKRTECLVYDVIFHADTIHLASKNGSFRTLVTDTALDAVESAFKVQLDRVNLKFPKLQYKGVPKCTVIREKAKDFGSRKSNEVLNELLRQAPEPASISSKEDKKSVTVNTPAYVCPHYTIVQRRDVDYGEMTHERDAKLHAAIPRELIVTIELPQLKSAAECALDVTKTALHLVSEKPAKYKLELKLPYEVQENRGTAKFNVDNRSLSVVLPVVQKCTPTLDDIDNSRPMNVIECDTRTPPTAPALVGQPVAPPATKKPTFPKFSVNKMENIYAFTLNVRNVDPASIELDQRTDAVHCTFSNVGGGFYPCHYAFFVRFPNALVTEVQHEEWDNNLIIQIVLNTDGLQSYYAGPDECDVAEYSIMVDITDKRNKFGKEIEDDSLCIAVVQQEKSRKPVATAPHLSIEISKKSVDNEPEGHKDDDNDDQRTVVTSAADAPKDDDDEDDGEVDRSVQQHQHQDSRKPKKAGGKRKNKKRSLSESCCDELKFVEPKENARPATTGDTVTVTRKVRSISECYAPSDADAADESESISSLMHFNRKYKGILKRSSFDRSISECSSVDDLGTSVEYSIVGSVEGECRKTVRFSDAIKTQLFRSNTSILGHRRKNQKKNESKRRAITRRLSEGESTDNDDMQHQGPPQKNGASLTLDKEADDDSGVSFESESGEREPPVVVRQPPRKAPQLPDAMEGTKPIQIHGASKGGMDGKNSKVAQSSRLHDAKDIEFKSDMIFDIDM